MNPNNENEVINELKERIFLREGHYNRLLDLNIKLQAENRKLKKDLTDVRTAYMKHLEKLIKLEKVLDK